MLRLRLACAAAFTTAAFSCTALALPVFAQVAGPVPVETPAPVPPDATLQQVTFDEAVARAVAKNPSVGEATAAILRAQGLLDQAKSVLYPRVYGNISQSILDDVRGFAGVDGGSFQVTQPRSQKTFNATASYAFFSPVRWAQKNQAADQVAIARISVEETRRQVALNAASAYLAVIAAERQREVAVRNRQTAVALEDYAKARLEVGQGSRLNHVRSTQELSAAEGLLEAAELSVRQAQEALGISLFIDAPVEVNGDAQLQEAPPPQNDDWLVQRPDVRLFSAQVAAADRAVRDSWKSWLPEGVASFTPQYVRPAGLFEPAKTWRALFELQIPIFDGNLGGAKRVRIADREAAQFRLDGLKVQARSEARFARTSVERIARVVELSRSASQDADEALRITEIAYRAGATTNIEVVQAQQTSRNTAIIAAQAEDRLRQARLDLLVALGHFPQ